MTVIEVNGTGYRRSGGHSLRSESAAAIVNALTVDVEDYYQVGASETRIGRAPDEADAPLEMPVDHREPARRRRAPQWRRLFLVVAICWQSSVGTGSTRSSLRFNLN
ncbi:MAG: hypothetical protein ACREJ5_05310 [Geminicoccaceae bacterium]